MASADRLTYPAGLGPEGPPDGPALLAACLAGGLAVFLLGYWVVTSSSFGLITGLGVAALAGRLLWQASRLASGLAFSDGLLSWRNSLPGSARIKSGRIRVIRLQPAPRRAEQRVRIELDDGRWLLVRRRAGLDEFLSAVRAADPAIATEFGSPDMAGVTDGGGLQVRGPSSARWRAGVRTPRGIVGLIVTILFSIDFGLSAAAPAATVATLGRDLAQVHLPAAYSLADTVRTGTDCHDHCSISELWTSLPVPRSTSTRAPMCGAR